jgi:hypothetical protein
MFSTERGLFCFRCGPLSWVLGYVLRMKAVATAPVTQTTSSPKLRSMIEALGIERHRACKLLGGGTALRHEFNITAEDFLQQAEDDFESKGNAARLNALSNAKRAIHAQIDEVLIALGYKVKGISFDMRARVFAELGFVAPRLLKRVNRVRNLLEHEYKLSTLEEVEEAIDLAGLFVSATKRHSELWEHEFTIGNEDEALDDGFHFSRQLQFTFKDKEKAFGILAQKDVHTLEDWHKPTNVDELDIVAPEPLFGACVKLVLAGDRERKIREALDLVFSCVGL